MAVSGGKWIDGLEAATPIADAARRVLSVRFNAIRHYLPLSIRWPSKDPEPVHQLRVCTRRARAALDTFSVCLREKVTRRAKKFLRRIRRTAGDARDWDVFLITFSELKPTQAARNQAGTDFLTGYALSRRSAAQAALGTFVTDHSAQLETMIEDTLAALRQPKDRSMRRLMELAQPRLVTLLDELQDSAARDLSDYGQLHRVRIAGKRLRYAMEIFGSCFPPPFRETLYPAIENMQDILGNANDSHGAADRLKILGDELRGTHPSEWTRCRAGINYLRRFHERRLSRERRDFEKWWKRWQGSGGRAAFLDMLDATAKVPPRRKKR